MIPHDIQRNRRDAARFATKPFFGFTHLRQVICHHVDTTMHEDAFYHIRRVVRFRITPDKIGQQIAGKRTVGKVSEMQMCKKIHS
ncbi:hypothetical protein SDC9_196005 [bioreactor metagenome]|uniref:Uncharacterized protein n=1 Tax=bioreactor metagenome TaxID=1076179 RepID=A0A645IAV4_9ZZZZ